MFEFWQINTSAVGIDMYNHPTYYCQMGRKKSVKSVKEEDLNGKKVFVRVDLNVPMDYQKLKIIDDSRIRDALPTINYLVESKARVILASHLGCPEGVTPIFSLMPLVPRLSELLGLEVKMASDCIGPEVKKLVDDLPKGGVLLLENLRFHKEEYKGDDKFEKDLASLADVFVNEAFGTTHVYCASTEGVAYLLPAFTGVLMRKELDILIGAVTNPQRPFAAIVGGFKLSTKINLIESLLEKVDTLLIGGGIVFSFYQAQGKSVGSSFVEEQNPDESAARSLIEKAKAKGVKLLIPVDVVISEIYGANAKSEVAEASKIRDEWMGLDIGPDTITQFGKELDTAKSIIWNGPMGVLEYDTFAAGTEGIAIKLAELTAKGVKTIIVGVDTVAAVKKVGLADKMTYVSTGRRASVELLGEQELPGVIPLKDDDIEQN